MARYEVHTSEELGRYLVAAKDLKAGEKILSDEPYALGPNPDTSLVCFNCYLPLINKFMVCKSCAVAPICAGNGCPEPSPNKWHTKIECELFRSLKPDKGLHPLVMVQNVGTLLPLRAILKKWENPTVWKEFLKLETHIDERKNTEVWNLHKQTVKFIKHLDLLDDVLDVEDLVQKICGAIDVNSFEVRGPQFPAIKCAETLRGIYLNAALLAHDCIGNTHISINDNNLLVCHASVDVKRGETLYYNYTDPLKGTAHRQEHLRIGKYFKCSCSRCSDASEIGTYLSSALCPECKTGYVSKTIEGIWICHSCKVNFDQQSKVGHLVQCCLDKFEVIDKKDEKELEEYIKNVSLLLAPNHFVLLDAKQRLAGVLRDTINREKRPSKKLLKRKIELCKDILSVLHTLCPGISRLKAITLYELHVAMVQLAKILFDCREIAGSTYMDELLRAEALLKNALQMLFIEPGNSPEGELCAKALEEYRALKATMSVVLNSLHADGKTCITTINEVEDEDSIQSTIN